MSAASWAVDAMIASALLMALVLAVRGPVRRWFGPRIGYALWALPLLRLVLPPLPAAWHARVATPIGRAGETLVLIVQAPAPASAGGASWGDFLVAGWAIGAIGFLAFHVVAHWRFCRRIVASAALVERVGGIQIIASAAATGPLAFGIWRRYVALPTDVADRYDVEERALALAHEIGHHRRGDLIANWAALTMLALHWCDPIAWHAFRAFRADQELANDARVLAGRSANDRHVYARAIVKAAHGGAVSATCHLHTIADLKGRLKMLSLSPTSRRRLASGAATVGALVVAGLGLTASGSGAAAISAGVQQAVTPSVPPAPPASSQPISRVEVTKDGKTTMHDDYTSADIDAHATAGDRIAIKPAAAGGSRMIVKMPDDPSTLVEVQDVPAISSAKCGIGTGTPATMVIQNGRGPKRKVVICTDRIRQIAADAMATAAGAKDIERNAYIQALAGLIDARMRIAGKTDMTDGERTQALTTIDGSIGEMKGQLARFN